MRYAYFPGCAALESAKEAYQSTKNIAKKLDIELIDVPEFSCCGAGLLQEDDPDFSLALAGRNFSIAEKMNLDIVTICNTCCLVMLQDKKVLDENQEKREKINKILKEVGHNYQGKVKIKHLLWVLLEDETLKSKIKKSLRGGSLCDGSLGSLKIFPFYGCHIFRPFEVLGFESEQNPQSLENLISILGGKTVTSSEKLSCCGFHILLADEKISLKMTANILKKANEVGADCVVTPCTLCHINLDSYQRESEKLVKENFSIPVLHLAQIIGLAMGMSPKELNLNSHLVSVKSVLRKIT